MTNACIIEAYTRQMGITGGFHTFAGWKERGYSVKKGEHSNHKLGSWKHTSKKYDDAETHEQKERTSMFMTTAAFFTEDQVEKI